MFDAGRRQLELVGCIFPFVIGLDGIRFRPADNMRRAIPCYAFYFASGRFSVRVEEADNVGYVLVGEARVLLAYAARIENILGS